MRASLTPATAALVSRLEDRLPSASRSPLRQALASAMQDAQFRAALRDLAESQDECVVRAASLRVAGHPGVASALRGAVGEARGAATNALVLSRAQPDWPQHVVAPSPQDTQSRFELASYLFLRNADHRPIKGEALKDLRHANEVVFQTRREMRLGRGNFQGDLSPRQTAYRRTVASRFIFDLEVDLPANLRLANNSDEGREAGIARFMQAGNCREFSMVALTNLAATLNPGEAAKAVSSLTEDHCWAQLTRADNPDEPEIIVDAWAAGPAIFAQDSAYFAKGPTILNSTVTEDSAPDVLRSDSTALRYLSATQFADDWADSSADDTPKAIFSRLPEVCNPEWAIDVIKEQQVSRKAVGFFGRPRLPDRKLKAMAFEAACAAGFEGTDVEAKALLILNQAGLAPRAAGFGGSSGSDDA